MLRLNIPNTNIRFIRSHKSLNLLGALGQKTVIFLTVEDESLIRRHHFVDENVHEMFTCLDFLDINNRTYGIVGGQNGIIKIIEVNTGRFYGYISAHTGIITDIKVYKSFIISASDDCSVKVWDFTTFSCVKIFGGFKGHSEAALTLEIDFKRSLLLTTGLDLKILEWKIHDTDNILNYEPYSSTENIHKSRFIRCQYYDNLIITLSEDSRLSVIKPKSIKNIEKNPEISKYIKQGLYDESKDYKINNDIVKQFSSWFNEDQKIVPDLILLKEICLGDHIVKDIKVHGDSLICLTEKSGLFILKLKNLLEDNLPMRVVPKVESEGLCIDVSSEYIYALYIDGTILGIKIK